MTCPNCGQELAEGYRFCPFCGATLDDAPDAHGREERKVVSVVFADLVGFTARAEQLDPEDVRALLTSYHAHLRVELERFGGTVEKFIGDAVMAVFGAPTAHEDDPERAVRAALAIRDWALDQEELQVRVAVNTGEALVALDARAAQGEALVAGDVVNTAARLQAAAPLNGVLVSEQAYRATVDAVEYRPAEPVTAKGKSEPVAVWEAVEARARVGAGAVHAPATPLVGRERELELLVQTLARVREERAPQLVTLVGVPGIGKSRVVTELARVAEEDDELVSWREGRSLPYGDGVTFWALSEIVKAQAGILESDSAQQAQEKLRGTVVPLAREESEAQWLERHLRPLAGLADETSADAGEVFAAWRRFLEALADERPLVLVFEDLHWSDDALLDFVDELVERVGAVPLLVLATARPELLQRRPGWGGGKPNAATISLPPLTDAETARLLQTVLDQSVVEAGTQATLLARAGGNPLYAEQYARVLLERGDVSELPETVQGIIAARLDALSEDEKLLLQDAAVVGKTFWLGAVEAVGGGARWQVEELLHALERKEFIQRSRSSSVASESEYAFRHLLIRDVAYGQIPRAARARKHQAAAGWIESLGRPEEQAELLAHHYVEALELAEAAGLGAQELAQPAREALRDAGDRAASLYAIEAAQRFYDSALRLWPEGDPARAQLLFRRALPVRVAGDGDVERLAEASEALLAAGDRATAAEAEAALSSSYWHQGRHDLSNEHKARAASLIESTPPSRARARVQVARASWAGIAGDRAHAIELATEGRTLAEQLGLDEALGQALNQLGLARIEDGDRDGLADLERGVEVAEKAGALGALSVAYNNLAVAHQILGELDAGYDARLKGAQISEQIGSAGSLRWFQGVLTDHRYRRGDWDEALRTANGFLADVDAGSPHYLTWQVAAIRAELRLARGDRAGAITDIDRALATGRAATEPQELFFVLAAGAHVYALASERGLALPLARDYLDALSRGEELQFAVINLPTFAAAAWQLGLAAELATTLAGRPATPWTEAVGAYAHGDFTLAADALGEIGARPEEAEARLQAAGQLVAEGRRAEADGQLQQTLAFYRSVGATRYLHECESLLAAAG